MAEASQSTSAPGVTDVAAFIDEQPIGRFQIRLLLTCAAVLFLDGFDTQGIGYVAPALAHDWSLARGALGPVFSAGLLGNMIGALLFGPVADRIGRKRIVVLSTAAFGLGTLATVFAQDITSLLVIRFLTGLGLGGALPNVLAPSGQSDASVAELLTRVAPPVRFPSAMRFGVREAKLVGLPIGYLLSEGRALATLVLWAVFFTSLLDLYLLLNWLPTVLNDLGASVSVAAAVGAK